MGDAHLELVSIYFPIHLMEKLSSPFFPLFFSFFLVSPGRLCLLGRLPLLWSLLIRSNQ